MHTPQTYPIKSSLLYRSYLAPVFPALLLTGLCFTLMIALIASPEFSLDPGDENQIIGFTQKITESPPKTIVVAPKKPEPELTPDAPVRKYSVQQQRTYEPVIDLPYEPIFDPGSAPQSRQLVIALAYPPQYPASALRRAIEGYVDVAFSVDQAGQVFDARVIAADPQNVFDRAALRAIQRFRYQPRLVNGKAVVSHNQEYRFRFSLE